MATNKVEPNEIGWMFVPQFYTFVNKEPARLHCFYTKKSTFIHGEEGEECAPCYGQQGIHDKIMSLDFQDCKVYVSNVDSQSSAEGGIIVQVLGEMSNKDGPWRKFAQTFFLAEQPTGYFVLNDIFRYLKDSDDDESQAGDGDADVASAVDLGSTATAPSPTLPHRGTEFGTLDTRHALLQPSGIPPVHTHPSTFQQPSVLAVNGHPHTHAHVNGFHGHPSESALSVSERSSSPPVRHVHPIAREPEVAPPALVAVPERAPSPVPEPAPPAPEPKAEPVAPVPVPEAKPEPKEPAAPQPPKQTRKEEQAAAKRATSPAKPAEKPAEPLAEVAKPTPTPPAAPAKPAAKTWANLAAVAPKQGVTDARGVIVATAPQTASTSAQPAPSAAKAPIAASTPAPQVASTSKNARAPTYDVDKIQQPNCYVRDVPRNVDRKLFEKEIKTRFGALRDLDFQPDRQCAFLEFASVESARVACQKSLPTFMGGDGGVTIGTGAAAYTVSIEPKRTKGEKLAQAQAYKGDRRAGGAPAGMGASSGPTGKGSYASPSGNGEDGGRDSQQQHKKTGSTSQGPGKKGQQQPTPSGRSTSGSNKARA